MRPKAALGEGGIRVPFVVRGPGVPAGTVDATPVVLHDLYPTFAELAGARGEVPEDVEGGSLVTVVRGESGEVARARDGIVFHVPGDSSAIVAGPLKLVQLHGEDPAELYDLAADPAEEKNLAAERAGEAAALAKRLAAYLAEVGAGAADGAAGRRARDRRRERDGD